MKNRGEKVLLLAKQWVKKVGAPEARLRLANTKIIGWSTAEKIAKGDYVSVPGHDITEALLREMKKDGFCLDGEKAS